MRRSLRFVACVLAAGVVLLPGASQAAVIVLANRSAQPVAFTLRLATETQDYKLASSAVLAFSVPAAVEIAFSPRGERRRYELGPNTVHFFAELATGLDLQEIGLGEQQAALPRAAPARPAHIAAFDGKAFPPVTIPVRLLVDEEEPTTRPVWEARLRKRLKAASEVLERTCGIRFEAVAAGTWESDNGITVFEESLRDFEQKVRPQPGQLAIGFTSQYRSPDAGHRLGVTRHPLHTHILMREWFPRSEAERTEVLVHELGHYLGATHSPEPDSVMRGNGADGKALVRQFALRFDPVNTLALCLVAEELRARGVSSWSALQAGTRSRLHDIYAEVARTLPDDASAAAYVRLTDQAPTEPRAADRPSSGLIASTRTVIAAVVEAAERNRRLPSGPPATRGQPARLSGDRLMEYYYQAAARTASRLPPDQAVPAYLQGLAVAIDTADLLRKQPLTAALWLQLESESERQHRLEVLGLPTVQGRHDFAQHFAVSGGLTALAGAKAAEAAGVFKELLDAQGDSGFSFADLAADLAGVTFAERLRQAPGRLARLATSFRVADYTLNPVGLSDGLSWKQFTTQYGSITDERYRKEHEALRKRVLALPGYQEEPAKPR